MAALIHLNGPPGIGKSTIARMYADAHPGVLNCDVDVLLLDHRPDAVVIPSDEGDVAATYQRLLASLPEQF